MKNLGESCSRSRRSSAGGGKVNCRRETVTFFYETLTIPSFLFCVLNETPDLKRFQVLRSFVMHIAPLGTELSQGYYTL